MDQAQKERFLNHPEPGALTHTFPSVDISPVTAFEAVAQSPYAFLLESLGPVAPNARFSYLGTQPYAVIKSKGKTTEYLQGGSLQTIPKSPFDFIRTLWKEGSVTKPTGVPSFFGGGVGFFGYDLARLIETLPSRASDDLGCPDMVLMLVDTLAAFDRELNLVHLIYTPPRHRILKEDRRALYEEGEASLLHLKEKLIGPPPPLSRLDRPGRLEEPRSNFSREAYVRTVHRCKEFIASGDIYQANLSQRLSVASPPNSWMLYKALREINPSPFSGYLQMGDLCLVGASPERLLHLSDGILQTRPIAGTRPRGRTPLEDQGMGSDLLASEKERAEHLMLVDLERNDLGKVCRAGTVRVDEFMATERYSHVMHIVSNIRGQLAPGRDWIDALQAVFPGGTITGVPKIRCMQIIDELEPVTRGPYSGSMGYINWAGETDLNIIIRTLVIKDGMAHIQVGGGIVADSVPEMEYQETLYKAEALLKALAGAIAH